MVCERHFKPKDFRINGVKKSLNLGAVPSIFDVHTPQSKRNENETPQSNTNIKTNRRRYCKIKYCKYESGTADKQILFFG